MDAIQRRLRPMEEKRPSRTEIPGRTPIKLVLRGLFRKVEAVPQKDDLGHIEPLDDLQFPNTVRAPEQKEIVSLTKLQLEALQLAKHGDAGCEQAVIKFATEYKKQNGSVPVKAIVRINEVYIRAVRPVIGPNELAEYQHTQGRWLVGLKNAPTDFNLHDHTCWAGKLNIRKDAADGKILWVGFNRSIVAGNCGSKIEYSTHITKITF